MEGAAELDKDQSLLALQKNVYIFSLHIWYYFLGLDEAMINLLEHTHNFTVDEFITSYREIRDEPTPDFESDLLTET